MWTSGRAMLINIYEMRWNKIRNEWRDSIKEVVTMDGKLVMLCGKFFFSLIKNKVRVKKKMKNTRMIQGDGLFEIFNFFENKMLPYRVKPRIKFKIRTIYLRIGCISFFFYSRSTHATHMSVCINMWFKSQRYFI